MGRLQGDIAATRQEIERTRRDMHLLYRELGTIVFTVQDGPVEHAEEAYRTVCDQKTAVDTIATRIEHVKTAIEDIRTRTDRVSQLRNALKGVEECYDVLMGRAGAIAYEAAKAGTFYIPSSSEFDEIMKLEIARKEEAEAFTAKQSLKLVQKIRDKMEQKKDEKLIRERTRILTIWGKKLDEAGLITELPGSQAHEVAQHVTSLKEERAGLEEELDIHKNHISQAKGALEEAGATGFEQRRLEELRKALMQAQKRLSETCYMYGLAVRKQNPEWLTDTERPFEVFKCVDQVLRHERRIESLEKRIEDLEVEIKVEELEFIIAQDAERVAHLQRQITTFQRQILEIQTEMNEYQAKITELRHERELNSEEHMA